MNSRALLALCVAAAIAGCAGAPETRGPEAEMLGPPIAASTAVKVPAAGAADDIAAFDLTPDAMTEGHRYPLLLDTNRGLVLGASTASIGAVTVSGAGAVVGGGLEATAQRVTIASDSTGVLSVDDNGSTLTVDNAALAVVGTGVSTGTTLRITQSTDDLGVASLSVLDDWDETNRAAVNVIAGQVGIAGGTGVDGATVPRVSLATNVGLPAGANNIGDVDVLIGGAVATGNAGVNGASVQRMTLATDDELNDDADAARVALEIIDDWDETNRGAVNLIAGQAGIAGGTGVDGATVPRVTLATNVGLPAGTANIGDVDVLIGGAAAAGGTGVDGATVQRVSLATNVALPAGTNNIGDVDILTINGQAPAFGAGASGATVMRITQSTDDVVTVDWNGTAPPIGGGVQATALRTTTATDSPSIVAPDAAFPANTVAISARASTAKPAAMSGDADAVGLWTSRVGSVRTLSGEVAYVTSTQLLGDLAAVGANTGNRLVVVTVRERAGAAARVMIRNGAADTGTLIGAVSLAANEAETITYAGGINADSGVFLDWITGDMEVTVGTEDHE